MGYYIDMAFKSNYETYQEYLEFAANFNNSWEYKKYVNGGKDIDAEYVEDMIDDDVYFDENGDICIKVNTKYGTLVQQSMDAFARKLEEENREEDFSLAEAGEEYDDYGVRGEYDYDVDVYVYKEIEPALIKPKKLKKGALFININI